jgi:hypothetical protein
VSARQFTAEDRRRGTAARQANIAATRPTTRPGSETTTLTVGDAIRVNRELGRSGTWGLYDGREGWVSTVNRQTFPNGTTYVEVGVCWFKPTNWSKVSAEAWFRADELVPR